MNELQTKKQVDGLEVKPKKPRKDRYAELERRIKKLEEIARSWEMMYHQLEAKTKALSDRQGNIQAVYDYMTQIGSTLVKKGHSHTFVNPMPDGKIEQKKGWVLEEKKDD